MDTPVIRQYLTRHAEPEARGRFPDRDYQHALVIPACREKTSDVTATWQHLDPVGLLVIVVINTADPADKESGMLFTSLQQGATVQSCEAGLLCQTPGQPDRLLVDRFSTGRQLQEKQAVGHARKIGCDIALAACHQGHIASPWISTTDADAILPATYFLTDSLFADPQTAALSLPFRHVATEPALADATLLYEIYMLHYAAGLRDAGSPYAFPAIGSVIRFSAGHYAKVRGFPKRATGEDFYLLNKLRKTGEIRTPDTEPVILAGRLSDRVPIGTGTAIQDITDKGSTLDQQRFEHPECFRTLGVFLQALDALAENPDTSTSPGVEMIQSEPLLAAYAEANGFWQRFTRKASEAPAPAVMGKFLHDWFDALRTRQFVHFVRDRQFGTRSFNQLHDGAPVAVRDRYFTQIYQSEAL